MEAVLVNQPLDNVPKRKSSVWLRLFGANIVLAVSCGIASAFFLLGLRFLTDLRSDHPVLFLLAPVAGLLTGILCARAGPIQFGSLLIASLMAGLAKSDAPSVAEQTTSPRQSGLQRLGWMAPFIIATTWLAHAVGASVGREGSAIQIGGGLSSLAAKTFRIRERRSQLMMLAAGAAAGFSAVFGVPLAGAVLPFELIYRQSQGNQTVAIGELRMLDWFSIGGFVLVTSILGDQVCRLVGATHLHYPDWSLHDSRYALISNFRFWCVVLIASIAFGIVAWAFLIVTKWMTVFWHRLLPSPLPRSAAGGALFIAMFFWPAQRRFAGLGTESILRSFTRSSPLSDVFAKLLWTAHSLGAGFRGGEVTPLFFVGSSLGSYFASVVGFAPSTLASLGLVAVFAAAAGLPLTCAIMASELMGLSILPYAVVACFVANAICRGPKLFGRSFVL